MISGILSISGIPLYVLIDSGATHSFISDACLERLNLIGIEIGSTLEVSLPSGETIDTNKIVKAVQIDFDGQVLEADLNIIRMKDFDIILGMDWLNTNRAAIMCHEKEVIFRKDREEVFRFYGTRIKALTRLISALQAEKLLAKDSCHGYLVSLQDKP